MSKESSEAFQSSTEAPDLLLQPPGQATRVQLTFLT